MIYELLIRPEAERDLAEAFRWYERRKSGLGEDLIREVEAALEEISEFPLRWPVVCRDIRRRLVRRFPYGVFYYVDSRTTVVLAVFHAKRDPSRWQDRR